MPAPHLACPASIDAQLIGQAHQLYNELTGQTLRLGFDRERQWFELLRAGYTLADLRTVIIYLQREIRAGRRYVGALKLSNLHQPDRFEEDLHISRVRLRPPAPPQPLLPSPPPLDPTERERRRLRALDYLQQLKAHLR
jgi:hypothetical protein